MKLIDTSVLIDDLKKGTHEEGSISIITLIEFLRGIPPEKRSEAKRLLETSFEVLSIDNRVVLKYCELYTLLRQKGEPIPDADLLIAATAIANNLTLVTKDEDFERLKKLGLNVEVRKEL